jgi:hypothetical protein
MTFERIHEIGAAQFPSAWLIANSAATHAVMGDIRLDDPAMRLAVSRIVLRVLQAVLEPKREAPRAE